MPWIVLQTKKLSARAGPRARDQGMHRNKQHVSLWPMVRQRGTRGGTSSADLRWALRQLHVKQTLARVGEVRFGIMLFGTTAAPASSDDVVSR